jgi:hypothetical protein
MLDWPISDGSNHAKGERGMSEEKSEGKGQFVQFPVNLIYGNPNLTRDDKWVLLALMGKCWEIGPHRLSYREIAKIADVPVSLLSTYTDKNGKQHEGILDRIVRVTGYLQVIRGKEVDPITEKPRKQAQTYIYVDYPRIWRDNASYCQARSIRQSVYRVEETDYLPDYQLPESVSNTNTSVSNTNTTVSHAVKSVSNTNKSVSNTNKSVHNLSVNSPPYITDYVDITDKTDYVCDATASPHTEVAHEISPEGVHGRASDASRNHPTPPGIQPMGEMGAQPVLAADTPTLASDSYSQPTPQATTPEVSPESDETQPLPSVAFLNTATNGFMSSSRGYTNDAADENDNHSHVEQTEPYVPRFDYMAQGANSNGRLDSATPPRSAALANHPVGPAQQHDEASQEDGRERTARPEPVARRDDAQEQRPGMAREEVRDAAGQRPARPLDTGGVDGQVAQSHLETQAPSQSGQSADRGNAPRRAAHAPDMADGGSAGQRVGDRRAHAGMDHLGMDRKRTDAQSDGAGAEQSHANVDASSAQSGRVSRTAKPQGMREGNGRTPKPAPEPPPEFTEGGRKVYEAWCSLFRVAVPAHKSIIVAANDLYSTVDAFAPLLNMSYADVLKDMKDTLYAGDKKKGYYKGRGVKLFDCSREREGWVSAKEEQLREAQMEERRKELQAARPAQNDVTQKIKQAMLAQRAKVAQAAVN